jgi:hypothetical protein
MYDGTLYRRILSRGEFDRAVITRVLVNEIRTALETVPLGESGEPDYGLLAEMAVVAMSMVYQRGVLRVGQNPDFRGN